MTQTAWLPLKLHRFEISAAALAAVVCGIAALWVNYRLSSLGVTPECFEAWLSSGGGTGQACDQLVEEFGRISGDEAGKVLAAMAIVPFMVGLLGGVPVVGRELEGRTVQTAWWLSPSRRRWLLRRLWPIILVLGIAVIFAAAAASALAATRAPLSGSVLADSGLHGPIVVARALTALGLGLLAGAVLGRTLPAFIVGGVLCVALVVGAGVVHDAWETAQPPVVFEQAEVDDPGFDGIYREQAWRAPDGRIYSEVDAAALAPAERSSDAYTWLIEQGYEVVQLGITAETARGWEVIEFAGLTVTGLALIAATALVLDRRRPI